MSDEIPDQHLLDAWKQGDETSAESLFRRYNARLIALVRLSRKLARRVDPEDIVLSAYRSFFITARKTNFAVTHTETLWQLLTTFTLRKLAHQARRHLAARRSVEIEQDGGLAEIRSALAEEPTAEHAAALCDQVELILSQLDSTAREVFVLSLQGHPPASIAERLQIHERSVRRAFERIRDKFPNEQLDFPLTAILSDHRETLVRFSGSTPIEGTVQYDQYVLQQLVGTGAFSKVYRAIERSTGSTVAVKYLRKDCWLDQRASESLLREYDLLRQLTHPHILSIRGWGATRRGALFLVSEFIDGENLEVWGRNHRPEGRELIAIVRQVAAAVSTAHSRGILHGDIKPGNVLIGVDGRVVLCDFGFARYASAPEDVPRGGTAGFLAPEQISDQFGPITERTDVYGLGGLLYALLTGRAPMTGRDLPETLASVLSSEPPPRPSARSTRSSAELDDLVLRCLAKEPSQRPPNADQVAKMLRSLECQTESR